MKFNRSSGVLAHPTSFPSSYGIGDLGQGAFEFIDFLHNANQSYWQVLPLGSTSFGDSPYQSFSTFAGNPLLISPDILAEEGYLAETDIEVLPEFNPVRVDYGPLIEYKYKLYQIAFETFSKAGTQEQKNAYEDFCDANKGWLEDFALFVALKNHFIAKRKKTTDSAEYKMYKAINKKLLTDDAVNDYYYGAVWNSWPEDIARRKNHAMSKWRGILKTEMDFYKFLQYEFFRQWYVVKSYANEKGIGIIGDIPIFVALDSSDVWSNPELFHLDKGGRPTFIAGVPPDYFSETGQLWGNPLYNWAENKKRGYTWWTSRIASALSTADVLRIDHFRGFDAYWEVKNGERTAVNGKWRKGPGRELFDAITKELGQLPIIAEDLGLITDAVIELREGLSLPGMKVLQFAFDGSPRNGYLPHNIASPNTVLYTGTHDNDTTVGWYEQLPEEEKDLFRRYMNTSGDDPAWSLIRLAFSSVAELTIIPIQDVMGLGADYRMNTPGVAEGNWQFRYTRDMLTDGQCAGLAYLSELFERNVKVAQESPVEDICAGEDIPSNE